MQKNIGLIARLGLQLTKNPTNDRIYRKQRSRSFWGRIFGGLLQSMWVNSRETTNSDFQACLFSVFCYKCAFLYCYKKLVSWSGEF
jgi:hypothetical protein